MHICADWTSVYHPKEFVGNGVRSGLNPGGKMPSTGGSEEDGTDGTASRRTARPTHHPLCFSVSAGTGRAGVNIMRPDEIAGSIYLEN